MKLLKWLLLIPVLCSAQIQVRYPPSYADTSVVCDSCLYLQWSFDSLANPAAGGHYNKIFGYQMKAQFRHDIVDTASMNCDSITTVNGLTIVRTRPTNCIISIDSTARQALGTVEVKRLAKFDSSLTFGPGAFSAGIGKLYTSSTLGAVLTASTGSLYDMLFASTVGNTLLANPTGTSNLTMPGMLTNTIGNNPGFLSQPTTTTNAGMFKIVNGGGSYYFGADASIGGFFGTAGNYGMVVFRPASTGFAISRAGTVDIGVDGSGKVTIPDTAVAAKFRAARLQSTAGIDAATTVTAGTSMAAGTSITAGTSLIAPYYQPTSTVSKYTSTVTPYGGVNGVWIYTQGPGEGVPSYGRIGTQNGNSPGRWDIGGDTAAGNSYDTVNINKVHYGVLNNNGQFITKRATMTEGFDLDLGFTRTDSIYPNDGIEKVPYLVDGESGTQNWGYVEKTTGATLATAEVGGSGDGYYPSNGTDSVDIDTNANYLNYHFLELHNGSGGIGVRLPNPGSVPDGWSFTIIDYDAIPGTGKVYSKGSPTFYPTGNPTETIPETMAAVLNCYSKTFVAHGGNWTVAQTGVYAP